MHLHLILAQFMHALLAGPGIGPAAKGRFMVWPTFVPGRVAMVLARPLRRDEGVLPVLRRMVG